MLRRMVQWGLVGMLIGLMLGPGAVLADEDGGFLTPDGQWRMIDGSDRHWHAFTYDGEEEQITIRMNLSPSDSVGFKLLTPEGFRKWMETGEIECTGCGSENEFDPADLIWSGSFNTPGTYYIIVERTAVKNGPGYYALSIEGDGVYLLTPAEAAPAGKGASALAAVAEAPAPAPTEAKAGTGPADAVTATGEWMPLDVGQSIWFAFRYESDASDRSGINVSMDVSPDSGANFSVYTPEQIRLLGLGEEVSPVGRGAENEFAAGDLSWCGCFVDPDVYYVKVEQAGSEAANFALRVRGDDVW